MKITAQIIIIIAILFIPLAVLAEVIDKRFIEAKKAANRGNWAQFFAIQEEYRGHPLEPYFEFYYINRNFQRIPDSRREKFIKAYPKSPMAAKLRRKWLQESIKNKQWYAFLKRYKDSNNRSMQCYYLYALQQTGNPSKAYENIQELWLTGKNHPDHCDVIFDHWLMQRHDKTSLISHQYSLALKKYNFKLAKKLVTKMSPKKADEARAILRVYSNPYLVTKNSYLETQKSAEVISYGIYRLARRSPQTAINHWNKLKKRYQFNKAQKQRVIQAIALKFALRKHSHSTIWYRKLVGYPLDPVYQDWMIRSAIYHNDWKLVKDSIAALPKAQQKSSRWQYWYARALDKLGEKHRANQLFIELSKSRNYHGFLASLYCRDDIYIKHHTPKLNKNDMADMKSRAALQRAKILFQLNHKHEAKLELYYLMKYSSITQQYVILKLVSDWGWHTQVLRLSKIAKHKDDLSLRFPLRYHETVIENASLRKLNPALIYAIIRQESFFVANANSPAGAMGLMQLMPQTAHKTSKQFKLKYKGTNDLLHGKTNIKFGSAHLRKLYQQFNNHPVLVIAAYNAGRTAVKRWLPKNKKNIPADIWVETIPFYETRHYLKQVIAYYIIYQSRLGQRPSLKSMMKNINK